MEADTTDGTETTDGTSHDPSAEGFAAARPASNRVSIWHTPNMLRFHGSSFGEENGSCHMT
jgi:hypothetical protein